MIFRSWAQSSIPSLDERHEKSTVAAGTNEHLQNVSRHKCAEKECRVAIRWRLHCLSHKQARMRDAGACCGCNSTAEGLEFGCPRVLFDRLTEGFRPLTRQRLKILWHEPFCEPTSTVLAYSNPCDPYHPSMCSE